MPNMTLIKFGSRMNNLFYKLSGGKLMGKANGLPILLLTTTGRKSGREHTCPVVYLKDGENYIIMPGIVPKPDWLLNLMANPNATIQVGGVSMSVQANSVDETERDRVWKRVPDYWREYQAQYDEPLTILFLSPQL